MTHFKYKLIFPEVKYPFKLNTTENFGKEQTMCNKAFLGVVVRLTWGEERDIIGERKERGKRRDRWREEGRKRKRRHDGKKCRKTC